MSVKHIIYGIVVGASISIASAAAVANYVNQLPSVKCYTVPVDTKPKSKYPVGTFEYEVKRTE